MTIWGGLLRYRYDSRSSSGAVSASPLNHRWESVLRQGMHKPLDFVAMIGFVEFVMVPGQSQQSPSPPRLSRPPIPCGYVRVGLALLTPASVCRE